MNGKILVACIGNIFLGDDAFGVEVAKRLAKRSLPEFVTVIDFGIRSYDLAYSLMGDWDLIIVVDAMARGGTPGTLYKLEPQIEPAGFGSSSLDAHTMNPASVLQMVQALGGQTAPLLVIGCEPEKIEPDENGNMGLSAVVSDALDDAVSMIEDIVSGERSRPIAA